MEIIGETILKWLITFFLGTIIGIIGTKLRKEKKKNEEEQKKRKSLENAVQALLRNELIRRYREYKTKGEMTILDKENIDHLYTEYRNLQGNGTIKELYEDMENINIKIIKEKE